MNFYVETLSGHVVHDFTFAVVDIIKQINWLHGNDTHTFTLADKLPDKLPDNTVPVGSLGFILDWASKMCAPTPQPINVPPELLKPQYLLREAFYGTEKDINKEMFVKDASRFKGFTGPTKQIEPGDYFISEIIDIKSEWRAFIYQKEVLGLRNYSGDPLLFPDISQIKDMVAAYTTAGEAYTLDVGITEFGTCVIEVHDFFSCGFYGFRDLKVPNMLISTARKLGLL